MHAKVNPAVDSTAAPPSNTNTDPNYSARHAKETAAGELDSLIADVDHFVSRAAGIKDSDHARIRDRARTAMLSARDSLTTSAAAAQRQARLLANSANDYVHESPWQALGIAALVGTIVGYVAGRRR